MALEIRGLADSALETLTIQGHRSQLLRDAETYAMRKCHMSFRKLHGIRMEMILAWLYCRIVIPEIDASLVNIMPMNRIPAVTITYDHPISLHNPSESYHINTYSRMGQHQCLCLLKTACKTDSNRMGQKLKDSIEDGGRTSNPFASTIWI